MMVVERHRSRGIFPDVGAAEAQVKGNVPIYGYCKGTGRGEHFYVNVLQSHRTKGNICAVQRHTEKRNILPMKILQRHKEKENIFPMKLLHRHKENENIFPMKLLQRHKEKENILSISLLQKHRKKNIYPMKLLQRHKEKENIFPMKLLQRHRGSGTFLLRGYFKSTGKGRTVPYEGTAKAYKIGTISDEKDKGRDRFVRISLSTGRQTRFSCLTREG